MQVSAGSKTGVGRGRTAAVLVPAVLGIALLTASAVPAAQTLLPREKPVPHVPAPVGDTAARSTRVALSDTATPNARRAPRRIALLRTLPTVTTRTTLLTPTKTNAPTAAVKLDTLALPAASRANAATTTVPDYTRAKKPRLNANAVPEPTPLALALPAAFLLLPRLRRRLSR